MEKIIHRDPGWNLDNPGSQNRIFGTPVDFPKILKTNCVFPMSIEDACSKSKNADRFISSRASNLFFSAASESSN